MSIGLGTIGQIVQIGATVLSGLKALAQSHHGTTQKVATSENKQLSKLYDLRHINANEIQALATRLLDAGKINHQQKDILASLAEQLQEKNDQRSVDLIEQLQWSLHALQPNDNKKQTVAHYDTLIEKLKGLDVLKDSSLPATI